MAYDKAPSWLKEAERHIGLTEIPGPIHNATIGAWLAKLGAWWSDDETPWCGAFVAHCLYDSGYPKPVHWYRAKAWADYGVALPRTNVCLGAILVFDRQGGGHVGFYTGEDDDWYYVLGGNQSNGVNERLIPKSRLVAIRWPTGAPVTGGPIRRKDAVRVTGGEA